MVVAPVGVSPGFQKDAHTFEVAVHDSYIESSLSLHVHKIDFCPLLNKEVHTVSMPSCGGNPQGRTRQPTARPHGFLIDATKEGTKRNMAG